MRPVLLHQHYGISYLIRLKRLSNYTFYKQTNTLYQILFKQAFSCRAPEQSHIVLALYKFTLLLLLLQQQQQQQQLLLLLLSELKKKLYTMSQDINDVWFLL